MAKMPVEFKRSRFQVKTSEGLTSSKPVKESDKRRGVAMRSIEIMEERRRLMEEFEL